MRDAVQDKNPNSGYEKSIYNLKELKNQLLDEIDSKFSKESAYLLD